MNRIELKHIAVRRRNPFAGWQWTVHKILLVPFLAALFIVWARLWLSWPWLTTVSWADGLLLVSTAAITLTSLCLRLPGQNVVLAAIVIGGFAATVATADALTAIPFGPVVYNQQNIGRFLFSQLPWTVPLIWVIAILNSRGVARLILRGQRRKPNYGFWVIGLTILLVVLLELSFEPYATQVKEYWSWKPTKIRSDWYGTPWVNFLGWAVTSLVILLFVTPALINKSPVPSPPAYHSLVIWELFGLLFLTAEIVHHLWAVTALSASLMLIVGALSLYGAKSKKN
jgi:uncharacterized membrane protein